MLIIKRKIPPPPPTVHQPGLLLTRQDLVKVRELARQVHLKMGGDRFSETNVVGGVMSLANVQTRKT